MKKEELHIYIRVSGDKSAKKDNSPPAQEETGLRIGNTYNLIPIIQREGDENTGTSATADNLDNRPVFKGLLEGCEKGVVKHIFCTEWDRLARNEKIGAYIKGIFKKYGILFYDSHNIYDIKNNPTHELMLGISNVLSMHEIRLKNERVVRTLEQSAKKGKWSGGVMLPYGFRRQSIKIFDGDEIIKIESGPLEFHPDEVLIIIKIFKMSLEGIGTATIAKNLNEEGVPTRGRKSLVNGLKLKDRLTGEVRHVNQEDIIWRPNTILSILKNPIYKGHRRYKGLILPVTPMIEVSLWEAVQKNLKNNSILAGRNNKVHFYMLKGFIRCEKCGKGMYGIIKPKRSMRVYSCVSKRHKECNMRSINIDRLNEVVWTNFKESNILLVKAINELGTGIDEKKIKELEHYVKTYYNQISSIKDQQNTLLTLATKRIFSDEQLTQKNNEFIEEIGNLEGKIQSAINELKFLQSKKDLQFPNIKVFEDLNSDLDSKTDIEKRELLKNYIHQIRIGFDEKANTHIVKVIFNLELKLAPWIYEIPKKGLGWHPIGIEKEDGGIWELGPDTKNASLQQSHI